MSSAIRDLATLRIEEDSGLGLCVTVRGITAGGKFDEFVR